MRTIIFLMALLLATKVTANGSTVFKCSFDQLAYYITIENSNLNVRIGTSISTGNLGKAYFDRLHKVWVVIEYVDKGALPISITTIKPDSGAVHSRHSIWSADKIWVSQSEGNCLKL